MEKELTKYKKSLKTQNIILAAAIIIIGVFIVLSCMEVIKPAYADERWASAWNGFIAGISSSVIVLMIVGIIMNLRAMKNQDYLKKQYIKENDERTQEIARCAGQHSYWFETIGLVLGVIIGGYFNPTIAFVCLGYLFYICIVRLGLKIYFNKIL